MKTLVKALVLGLLLIGTAQVHAQKAAKFGHINFSELFQMMPGQDTVQAKYQAYANELRSTLDAMQVELENKFNDYQANLSKYTEIIKKTKERELQDLQSRIEAFQLSAQQDLSRKEDELTRPMIEKARKAIEDVAKEGGYTYIFNAAEGLLLFSDAGDNVMPLVKKKLGIQ